MLSSQEVRKTRGKFIVIEGPDGAGCSTQVRLLREHLLRLGVSCEATKEPTDGPFGAEIRKALQGRILLNPQALALAFAADRADHADHYRFQPSQESQDWTPRNTGIETMLSRGVWVISDRYVLSSLVYQTSQGLDLEWVTKINDHEKLITPDVTILISAPVDVYRQRIESRSLHLELFDDKSSLSTVQRKYEDLILTSGKRFCGVVTTVSGTGAPQEVHAQIMAKIGPLFSELQK